MRKSLGMLIMRGVFLACLLLFIALGKWHELIFNSIIFFGSLFVPWLGRKNEEFYVLDIAIMLIFILALIPSNFGLWQAPSSIWAMLFTIDKLYHIAGGACLAVFMALLLKPKFKSNRWVFYAVLILCTLGLGAAWELFEWAVSVLPEPWTMPSTGYSDSMLDMVADVIGAALAVLVLKLRRYF
jgi:hypothetical protein